MVVNPINVVNPIVIHKSLTITYYYCCYVVTKLLLISSFLLYCKYTFLLVLFYLSVFLRYVHLKTPTLLRISIRGPDSTKTETAGVVKREYYVEKGVICDSGTLVYDTDMKFL